MTLHTQFITMIAIVISGIYLGFATETFHRLVKKWQGYTIVRYSLEVLYWIMQTCLLFYLLYQLNKGEMRFIFVPAGLLGYSMYIVLCQKWYVKWLEKIIYIVKTVISWVVKGMDALIVQPVIWLLKVMLQCSKFLYRLIKKIVYVICYPLLFLMKKYIPETFFNNISKILVTCSTMIDNLKKYGKRLWTKWREKI